MPEFAETRYGFNWGAAKVARIASDEIKGWIVIEVDSPKSKVQVYVTKTGKMRLYRDGKELAHD